MKFRKTLTIALLSFPIALILIVLVTVSIQNWRFKEQQAASVTKLSLAKLELENRNYRKAQGLYSDLIIANSEDLDAVLGMNATYMLYDNYEESVKLLEAYIDKDDVRIQYAYAYSCLKLRDYEKVETATLKVFSQDPNNEDNLEVLLKAINMSQDKETLDKLALQIKSENYSQSFLMKYYISLMNFGENKIPELMALKSGLDTNFHDLVNIYIDNYPKIANANDEMLAKSKICFALINAKLYEYADPFVTDMNDINKYYENSLFYKSVINLYMKDYESTVIDIEQLKQYMKNSDTTNILLLEGCLGAKNYDKAGKLIDDLSNIYSADKDAYYYELYKLLYNYRAYDLFWKLYMTVSGKMTNHVTPINFLAMQVAIYRKDYTILPLIVDKIAMDSGSLTLHEKSVYTSAQALVAFNSGNVDKGLALIETSEELYFYEPLVQYVKSIIYNDNKYLDRAYELDLELEIPRPTN